MLPLLTIITMPDATSLISDLGEYGGPFFTEFYNIVKFPLGLIFAAGAISLIIGLFIKFTHSAK